MAQPLDLRQVRPSTFEPLLGSEFTAREPAVAFRLVAVERHGEQPEAPRSEPFTLVFSSISGQEQHTYALEHAALGRLEIFIVPIGPGEDGRSLYEAVFN